MHPASRLPLPSLYLCFFFLGRTYTAQKSPLFNTDFCTVRERSTSRGREANSFPAALSEPPSGTPCPSPCLRGGEGKRGKSPGAASCRWQGHKTRAGLFLGASYEPHLPAGGFPRRGQTAICPNLTNRGNNCGRSQQHEAQAPIPPSRPAVFCCIFCVFFFRRPGTGARGVTSAPRSPG